MALPWATMAAMAVAASSECCEDQNYDSSDGSCSSSFSSVTSSPKLIERTLAPNLKRNDEEVAERPDLPPRENGANFNSRRQHQQQNNQQQQQQQQQRRSYEGPSNVVTVGGNGHTDSSLRHFLAAGQTSNV